jgi:hypothetical protein
MDEPPHIHHESDILVKVQVELPENPRTYRMVHATVAEAEKKTEYFKSLVGANDPERVIADLLAEITQQKNLVRQLLHGEKT